MKRGPLPFVRQLVLSPAGAAGAASTLLAPTALTVAGIIAYRRTGDIAFPAFAAGFCIFSLSALQLLFINKTIERADAKDRRLRCAAGMAAGAIVYLLLLLAGWAWIMIR